MTLHKTKGGHQILRGKTPINGGHVYTEDEAKKMIENLEALFDANN